MSNFIITDGNGATADVAYDFSEIVAMYPITPSSPMAAATDSYSAGGRLNMFGQRVKLIEMQSEAGAIGAIHGALEAGSLATTFTSSQGLMLMVPVLYRIAGERLPGVIHVASRTVGTHALSIFGDHSDVMAVRQTGFALIASSSVQECADMAAIAHLSSVKGSIPFIHFFDGFRTSHELSRIEAPDKKALTRLMDKKALSKFRDRALNPEHPRLHATVQNGDVYFQLREANNVFYNELPDIVEEYMRKEEAVTGRHYELFDYYGAEDATDVIIAMGSVAGTIRETVKALNESAKGDKKYGFINVHLYRPFSAKHLLAALPMSVKRISVLDRCKEMGSVGEPLYLDVLEVIARSGRDIKVYGGRYGLSSKDTDPAEIAAVFKNMALKSPKDGFTIGINDDVTGLSLLPCHIDIDDKDVYSIKFWGLGGDGTVGANHTTIKMLGDLKDMYAQAYFEYDAKKSFGLTKSHLRLSSKPIDSTYYVKNADLVACHNESFIGMYDMVSELKKGGTFLLNCSWSEELEKRLPGSIKRYLADNNIRLFIIDAGRIAADLGLSGHTNIILQSAFFRVSGLIAIDLAKDEMKKAIEKSYGTKGKEIVEKNKRAVELGAENVREIKVPLSWKKAAIENDVVDKSLPAVVNKLLIPINKCKGDELPVSSFKGYEDGTMDMGLTAYEKRRIATRLPLWDKDKCVECNRCSLCCPHAVIRPFLLSEKEAEAAPKSMSYKPAIGLKKGNEGKYQYSLVVSTYDCTGCGSCEKVCPVGAISMTEPKFKKEDLEAWNYALSLSVKEGVADKYSVKGSQFNKPLVEFSAACAGCSETVYAKLLTQLYGESIYWANATGCSQAWGSAMPGIPYTTDERGRGPAWTNSLFENNAELLLGLYLSSNQQREREKESVIALINELKENAGKEESTVIKAGRDWLKAFDNFENSAKYSERLVGALEVYKKEVDAHKATKANKLISKILARKDLLRKKTFWMFGGDGWAYDIGFGGLDHALATGENINALIIDTEVYSNTGGQSSKATPKGAVAGFAAAGKKTAKKDLGAIFRSYKNVYVASIAIGADYEQSIKALREANDYKGPSVVIAYCPCTAHGLKCGMEGAMREMKRAVESGYWLLYRYNPDLERPLTIDSKEPGLDYGAFLKGETRFAALEVSFKDEADRLFKEAKCEAIAKRKSLEAEAKN